MKTDVLMLVFGVIYTLSTTCYLTLVYSKLLAIIA